jgi:DNA-directed RNA polymerase specialized sigma24 family protein
MGAGLAMTLTPADFGDLHARYHRLLFAYFLAQTDDPELAGDLLQATFERAIAAADSYHGESEHELRGWVRAERRAARRLRVNDNRSGSMSAWRAASCISRRIA